MLRPVFLALLLVLSLLAITIGVIILVGSSGITSKPNSCTDPPTRREWRSLWPHEKKDYIEAVQCLYNTPSKYFGAGSLLDDFVYVHMWIGEECMYSNRSMNFVFLALMRFSST